MDQVVSAMGLEHEDLLAVDREAYWIARMAEGDESAAEQLFTREFLDRIARFLYRMGLCQQDLPEVLQKVMITVWAKRGSFKRQENAKAATWIIGIAKKTAKSTMRDRRQRSEREAELDPDAPVVFHASSQEAQLIRETEITQALSILPAEQREAILLALVVGLKYKEVAAVQGRPVNTIKRRIDCGLQKIEQARQAKQRRE